MHVKSQFQLVISSIELSLLQNFDLIDDNFLAELILDLGGESLIEVNVGLKQVRMQNSASVHPQNVNSVV